MQQGPLAPTAASNDTASGIGTANWLDQPGQFSLLNQILADDGKNAGPATSLGAGVTIRPLKTAFAFSVPEEVTDVSVTFTVRRKKSGPGQLKDFAARLVLDGVVQSLDQSNTSAWSTTEMAIDYTFTGLTPQQVNDPAFGFALAVKNNSPPGDEGPAPSAVPYVDVISATASW